jgi:bifunctional DNA-binding transcriptional regulator/antitoxin component of YhaV-PrlF toxin-antitoxin module
MAKKQKVAGMREARQKRYRAARPRRGSAKSPAAPEAAAPAPVRSETVRLTLGPGGRFVIPKKLRKAMGVEIGDSVTAEVVDGELRVFSWETAVRKVQAMFAPYKRPGVSEVDELIKERQREFAMEERAIEADRRRAARMKRRHG